MKSVDSLVKVEKQRPAAAFRPLAEVFGEPKRLEKNGHPFSLRFGFLKIVVLLLIIGLNLSGLLSIGRTLGFFSDEENSAENSIFAAALNFSILAGADFSPEVLPAQETVRNVSLQSDGTLDFVYRITTQDAVGPLCPALELKDNVNNSFLPLNSFISTSTLFSQNGGLDLTGRIVSNDASFQNQACGFKLAVEGRQQNLSFGDGFGDREEINALISSGQWIGDPVEPPAPNPNSCMKINEVYYDPGTRQHPNSGRFEDDPQDEWVELYNSCNHTVNLQDWYLQDNSSQEILNQSYPILAGQYVVIAANASTWVYWPNIPSNAFKIAVGGSELFNGMANGGDRVFLFDSNNNQIDEVSWDSDTSAFSPSVSDVAEGHSISRVTAGVDTDTAADWMDTYSGSTPPGPNPGTNPHSLEILNIESESFLETGTSLDEFLNEPSLSTEQAPVSEPESSGPEIVETDEPVVEPDPVTLPEDQPAVSDAPPQDDEPDGDSGEADLEIL